MEFLVFRIFGLGVGRGFFLLLLLVFDQFAEGFEVGAFFYEAGDVDLGTDEVADYAAAIGQWCAHEEIHEW